MTIGRIIVTLIEQNLTYIQNILIDQNNDPQWPLGGIFMEELNKGL